MAERHTPLTQKVQVQSVLEAGGRIIQLERPGLLQLQDATGTPVPAWQNALRAALNDRKEVAL
ncbi:hypothetical protein WMR10_001372 [Stenotrophomonas maltophilia]